MRKLLFAEEACLVRAVTLQLYGCHKREHQRQSTGSPQLRDLWLKSTSWESHHSCPAFSSTAQKAPSSAVQLEHSYPIGVGEEVTAVPWARWAAGGLGFLCGTRGRNPEWTGLLSCRQCLWKGSLCGTLLTMLVAFQVSHQTWASSSSASSEEQPKVIGRRYPWLESLAAHGKHLAVLKNTHALVSPPEILI